MDEIESTMSHRELMDWLRFEAATSPLPDRMLDLHCSIIASLIVNLTRPADSQPVYPTDFLLTRGSERRARAEPAAAGQPVPADGLTESQRLQAAWRGG